MVRLPRNEKQTYRLISRPQIWPLGLTLDMTMTLNFQGEIWIFIYLNQNWPDCHETKSKHIDLNSRPQIWPMGLTLAMTLIFEFWRSYVILTIWWPRSGVRIYQIVTGVTSDVGVPSTHLVDTLNISWENSLRWIAHYPIIDKSTLVQLMVWCHMALGHYPNNVDRSYLTPYGIAGDNQVNKLNLQI